MNKNINRVSSNSGNADAKQESIRKTNAKRKSFFSQATRKTKEQSGLRDTQLRFKIDPKTNELTVFLVDKGSRKVIRTFPPNELCDLRDSEILELFT